jgi:hypothetical protein
MERAKTFAADVGTDVFKVGIAVARHILGVFLIRT